ncbi:MAG: transporter permease, partial [Tardiphaga sp.]|nr:transporter permease [Tardiphaga sp.]
VVSADTQNKPDIAVAISRKWFDTENVDVLVDVPTSAISLAVANVVKDKNKVALFTASGSSDLSGKGCTPNTIHWTYDTWALAHGTGTAITKNGGKTWFFLVADYAVGQALERDASAVVKENGGTVLGSVRHPLDTKDFSSFMLQAQASKAEIVGLANGGGDTINSIKSASEFGLVQNGQKLAGMLIFISDIHSLGLKAAQGLQLTTAFYWDLNDQTRAFGERFAKRNNGRFPSMTQAGTYSATLAYLAAVKATGSTKDGAELVKAIRDRGTFDDPLFGKTSVRIDGRAIHDMYLVEVKKPEESKKPFDYYKVISTIPAAEAFRPLDQGGCPLVKM